MPDHAVAVRPKEGWSSIRPEVSVLFFTLALAQEAEPEPWIERSFLIVASEKTFADALAKAGPIAVGTGIRFDLRGVGFDPSQIEMFGGLTMDRATCEDQQWDYPCYMPRGRWDEGTYLSIEHSSAVQGFTPGLYVVIAASGDGATLKPLLEKVKKTVPDAYIKKAPVYVGCMH